MSVAYIQMHSILFTMDTNNINPDQTAPDQTTNGENKMNPDQTAPDQTTNGANKMNPDQTAPDQTTNGAVWSGPIFANTMNPDQTAPNGAVWSGLILFAVESTKDHQQMTKQTTFVLNGRKKG